MLRRLTFLILLTSCALASAAGPVRSLLEIRSEGVTLQKWDVSCGAASLATLLGYHGFAVQEEAVARTMLRQTDPLRVKHRGGFSLLDLKRFSDGLGLEADAYQEVEAVALDKMAPAIVPVDFHGYPHFVVYRGRVGDTALLADPAFGNRTMPWPEFESAWQQNIAFVVKRPGSGTTTPGLPEVTASDLLTPTPATLRNMLR